ncbi:DNA-directed RNA polymerase [Candidatus Woesearchaeota archaeon]|nr:DNA-directed RNA polymerase [Candidatus Woesearchaeota archaeon]
MFYETTIKTHVRVPPDLFQEDTKKAVLHGLNKRFEGYISKDLGFVLGVATVEEIGEGVIIPGDGAPYYETVCKIYTFKPDLQEVVLGRITDIAEFGVFIEIGPIDGLIHVSQAMDDFVSFSKSKVLAGKESKKNLKVGDRCRARIIATSYKDPTNPKVGLTMRQVGLGSLKWIEEELKKKTKTGKAK